MADEQPTPEEWRDVVGYEDRYMVSDQGRVWSKERMVRHGRGPGLRKHAGRMLKLGRKPAGYPIVSHAVAPGVVRHLYVHRLVLEAFVGPCPEGHVARHLDDDKENNHLSNLSWGSESENAHDKIRNGKDHYSVRDACKWGHEFTPDNISRNHRYPGTRYCRQCIRDAAAKRNASPEVKAYKAEWQRKRKAARAATQ